MLQCSSSCSWQRLIEGYSRIKEANPDLFTPCFKTRLYLHLDGWRGLICQAHLGPIQTVSQRQMCFWNGWHMLAHIMARGSHFRWHPICAFGWTDVLRGDFQAACPEAKDGNGQSKCHRRQRSASRAFPLRISIQWTGRVPKRKRSSWSIWTGVCNYIMGSNSDDSKLNTIYNNTVS